MSSSPTDVSIELLDCGTLTSSMAMFEAGGDETRIAVPVPSWLIRHPDGLVLVDTGMSPALQSPGPYLDAVSLFFEVGLTDEQLVGAALAQHDVDAADIDIVILTHLHYDHAGGLVQIPNARVIVQAADWVAGADDEIAAANAFVADDYNLGHDRVLIDGDHDVFGDGRVTCLSTPGHTPGHQSVQVRLAEETVVLCGDCAYFERTLAGGPLPGFGHDLAQHADSLARLNGLGRAGARLIPGHDADVFARLPMRLA